MKKFADRLIQWGIKEGRTGLPWKDKTNENYDPYKIWVSEMMLQQTRVASVLPKFNQFISRFPNVEKLAKSTVEDVIQVWAGLGYYRSCLLYTSPSPRDRTRSRMPSSA